jgi:polysaccharide biosynthesis/export protein
MRRLRVAGALALFVVVMPMAGVAQETKPPATPPSAASPTATPPAAAEPAPAQAGSTSAQPSTATPALAEPKSLIMVDNSTYIIGAEDGLQITVWREPTLSGGFPVRPDGMISLVLLGDVPAAGLTPMQLGKNIEERLKKFIQDPSVAVGVTAVNSKRIFLIGEIGRVGPMALTPGMTPLQAISAAGGLSTFANQKRIYILRGAQGKQVKIPFNYKQALRGDTTQLITLQPGDTIVVP